MDVLDALRIPEFQIGDFLVPWGMVISSMGFVVAWFLILFIEQQGWTRSIWHLPLFFVALAVFFGCALGILFAP